MTLTLEKLTEYEECLRTEIVERECVLAAIKVLRSYNGNGQWPQSLELGPLAMRLIGPVPEMARIPAALPEPASQPVAPPRYVPPPQKVNQELALLHRNHGGDTRVVKWAIARMTEDFSLTNIATLLKREDYPLKGAEISVVLTRLKGRGEIQEIRRGSGPNPAVFRKLENAIPMVNEPIGQASDDEGSTSMNASA